MDEKKQTPHSKTIDERVAEIRRRSAENEVALHIDAEEVLEWSDGGWSAWDKS